MPSCSSDGDWVVSSPTVPALEETVKSWALIVLASNEVAPDGRAKVTSMNDWTGVGWPAVLRAVTLPGM